MHTLLECAGLTKIYPTGAGVFGIALSVAAGEVVGFVGPNGAGKTTTIRCLLGLSLADRGRILFSGSIAPQDDDGNRALFSEKARLAMLSATGYVPSETKISPHLKLSKFLELAIEVRARHISGREPTELSRRAAEIASLLRIDLDKRFGDLSRGTRQKFAVLLAWFFEPELLVLDEPTAGLDPLAKDQLHGMVNAAKERGAGVLYSSHDLHEIEDICDRVVLIREGRVGAIFDVDRLRNPLPWRFCVEAKTDPSQALSTVSGVRSLKHERKAIRFDFTGRIADVLGV